MKPLKKKVSITLDEDVLNQIKLIAEEDDRSFSQYVNLVLREDMEKKQYSAIIS
ncbi:MAG: toxin-antitoxin system protein [Oscillospiraceae bacterium]|nr:toxin-antitoxin system protein [Oscillospiraceae bacterium]